MQFGENNLTDVARIRNIDRAELMAANPQISGPYAPLPLGQEINLPLCQAPALYDQPAPAGPFSTPPQIAQGDPLQKSVVSANLKKQSELTPDE